MTLPIALLVLSYLIGGIPFGYLIVRLKTGRDVRSVGSGNTGATNVLRATGRTWGVVTLALDIAKGYFCVWLMQRVTGGDEIWAGAAAIVVMLGHVFPIYLKFKGGKAMASYVGVGLALAPWPVGVSAIVFVAAVAWRRHISLGSIAASASYPFAVWWMVRPGWATMLAVTVCSLIVIWRHQANIGRLLAGTESVFRFGGAE